MLIPEITLLAAVSALIVTLINSLLMVSARRSNARQLRDVRTELDAALSASQGLARHVRSLQSVQPNQPETSRVLTESEAEIVTHLRPKRA